MDARQVNPLFMASTTRPELSQVEPQEADRSEGGACTGEDRHPRGRPTDGDDDRQGIPGALRRTAPGAFAARVGVHR